MKKLINISCLLAFFIIFSGCGYKFQNQTHQTLYLSKIESPKYTKFYSVLTNTFKTNNIKFDPKTSKKIILIDEKIKEDCQITASDGQIRKCQMGVNITFQLSDENKANKSKTISKEQNIIINNNDILSSDQTKDKVLFELYSTIAKEIVDYLRNSA